MDEKSANDLAPSGPLEDGGAGVGLGTSLSDGFGADGRLWHDPTSFSIEAAGQSLIFLPSGDDRLKSLIALIDGAQTSFKGFYYRFADDEAGAAVRDALVRAARRGVAVSFLIDRFGSDVDDEYFAELTQAGGTFALFMPRFTRRYLIRNHQKLAIADEARAMIGGFNIADPYFAPATDNGWHDLGLQIEGSAVEQLLDWFGELEDWAKQPRGQFRRIYRRVRGWRPPDGPVQLLIGGPTRGASSWIKQLRKDLSEATQIDLVAAYFAPSARIMRLIGGVAQRGRVQLVTPAKSDNGATIGATRSLYHYLLGRGAQIWEFQPCKLHMKLLVIDDAVFIGSSNFDIRSLFVNLEIMLRIEDAALANRMRAFIASHEPASETITIENHKRHAHLWNRLRWNLSWFIVTVLDYNVSRRLNLGL